MYWIWIVIAAGLCFGGLKGKFIFSKICRKNLARIRSLDQPKVWQIFAALVLCVLSRHDYDWRNIIQAGTRQLLLPDRRGYIGF